MKRRPLKCSIGSNSRLSRGPELAALREARGGAVREERAAEEVQRLEARPRGACTVEEGVDNFIFKRSFKNVARFKKE